MITKPVRNSEGRSYAFEIDNSIVSLHIIQKVLSSVDGVSNIRTNRLFALISFSPIRVEFLYRGVDFVVMELYGDSDVFWIGPKNKVEQTEGVEQIEAAFKAYKLPLFHRIISRLLNRDSPEV